ncbi:MAG TPA: lysophospholipase [Bacteroidaceae bacterium]|nr:lysophospholipase [Bacteroidaceae bacterium]
MKKVKDLSRRKFFRNAGLGAAVMTGLPVFAASCVSDSKTRSGPDIFFNTGDIILFQGDSITDAGRDRNRELPNDGRSFGIGYANIIASELLGTMPEKELVIYNRGISGNKVYQLAERWQKDCLDLNPDILSILIGVNDYWHFRDGRYEGSPEIYEQDYRQLLNRTLDKLPDVKIIICEPFVLPGTSAVDESWLEPFSAYSEIAARIAEEFNAVWVPFQKVFNKAMVTTPAKYWAPDGVHPSMAGAYLMAETWINALKS